MRKKSVKKHGELSEFDFKLNSKTKNSYILYKKDKTYKIVKNNVVYDDDKKSYPVCWKLVFNEKKQ